MAYHVLWALRKIQETDPTDGREVFRGLVLKIFHVQKPAPQQCWISANQINSYLSLYQTRHVFVSST